jgi:hypothetical protein
VGKVNQNQSVGPGKIWINRRIFEDRGPGCDPRDVIPESILGALVVIGSVALTATALFVYLYFRYAD